MANDRGRLAQSEATARRSVPNDLHRARGLQGLVAGHEWAIHRKGRCHEQPIKWVPDGVDGRELLNLIEIEREKLQLWVAIDRR